MGRTRTLASPSARALSLPRGREAIVDWTLFSKKQIKAIELLADPEVDLPFGEIAKQVGVVRRTISDWRRSEEFNRAVTLRMEQQLDKVRSTAAKALYGKILKGYWPAIQLVMKPYFEAPSNGGQQVVVNVGVTNIAANGDGAGDGQTRSYDVIEADAEVVDAEVVGAVPADADAADE